MTENKRLKNVIFWLISQEIVESQEDFAIKLGYNPSALSQIVTGIKPLSKKFAQKIVNFCNMINSDYLFGDGEMLQHHQTISNIDNSNVIGGNINGSGININGTSSELLDVIKEQQKQISSLIEIINKLTSK
jgi:transcriptional regulator with XRE-family HTH domain